MVEKLESEMTKSNKPMMVFKIFVELRKMLDRVGFAIDRSG